MPSPRHSSVIVAVVVAGLGVSATADSAAAAIRCNKGFQLVQGSEISTPYCQDEYLAVVAREFGIRTTGARVRQDWGHKREICRLIGQDNRIRGACASENDSSGDSSPSFH